MNKKLILSYIISIIFIAILVSFIDIPKVSEHIIGFGLIPFVIIIVIEGIAYIVRGFRWKILVKPFTKISLKNSFSILVLGFFVNNLLPARAGEFVRAYLLSKKQKLGKTKSLSTVISDRLIEMLALILIFVLIIVFASNVKSEIQELLFWPAIIIGIISLAFFFSEKFIKIIESFLHKMRISKNKIRFFSDLFSGSNFLKLNIKEQLFVWFMALIPWALIAFNIYFISQTLGIPLTIFQAGTLLVLTAFIAIIPSAPGFVGTLEGGMVFYLTLLGIEVNQATAFVIIFHLGNYIITGLLGLISMKFLDLTPKKLFEIKKQKINIFD